MARTLFKITYRRSHGIEHAFIEAPTTGEALVAFWRDHPPGCNEIIAMEQAPLELECDLNVVEDSMPPEDWKTEASPAMQQLRDGLDAAGIEWYDDSSSFSRGDFSTYIECTKILKDGEQVASCIWSFYEIQGKTIGISYGWSDYIECWCDTFGDEPAPKTVKEILAAVKAIHQETSHS